MPPAPTSNQREEEILAEIRRAGGSCRITYLAERLGVTSETIRRNIRSLETGAVVRRVHGGVHLRERLTELPFANRMDAMADVKARLAQTVAGMIDDGDSVFLDVGSTTAYVAHALRQRQGLFVVTNSSFVAHTLASHNGNRVFMAGGELRAHNRGAFGAEALDLVGRLNVRFAVLSVSAINAASGFMLHDMEEANLARVAARRAQVRIAVTVSDKFNTRAPVVLDPQGWADILVTDRPPQRDILDMLKRRGIDLILAGQDT